MRSSKQRSGRIYRIVLLILFGGGLFAGRAQGALIPYTLNVALNAANVETYNLDVDQNGTTDFTFTAAFVDVGIGVVGFDTVDVPFGSINGVVIDSSPGSGFPTASLLGAGDPVSAAGLFSLGSNDQSNLFFVTPFDPPSGHFVGKTGFVGLKFDRGGQPHFGFAEVTVNALSSPNDPLGLTIGLVGYNDVAREGTTVSQAPEPGTLALSAIGLVLAGARTWSNRRRERREARTDCRTVADYSIQQCAFSCAATAPSITPWTSALRFGIAAQIRATGKTIANVVTNPAP